MTCTRESVSALISSSVPFAGNEYLKLVSTKKELVLDPQDGSALLSEQNGLFFNYVAIDFEKRTNKKGKATGDQIVRAYDLIEYVKAATVFHSVGVDLDMLCLTQAQIINFAKKYQGWIPIEKSALFFLFKSGPEFFVACVFKSDSKSGNSLRIVLFDALEEEGHSWPAMNQHRIILPHVELS